MTAVDPAPGQRITVLMIEAVGRCNATCSYCPRGAGLLPQDSNQLITMEILDKALDLAQGGRNRAVYLHHRGEPFLHPRLPDVVRRVRARGFFAFLSTNLISATPTRVRRVLEAGINQIEMHFSAGLTRLSCQILLQRIHEIRRLNWEVRNDGCRLEMNFALTDRDRAAVLAELEECAHFDANFYVRWFKPHDWPSLSEFADRGVDYRACQWYAQKACAVLANGDVVICCLDQFGHSRRVNVMEIDSVEWEHLANRRMCAGCLQHVEMDWLQRDAIDMPKWLSRKQQIDTWTASSPPTTDPNA